MKDKIELTEEMVNTLENPPKANDVLKAAAKKYKGEGVKMADVFDLPIYQCKSSKKIIKDARYDALARYDWEKEAEAAAIAINNHDNLVEQVAELRAALLSIKNRQQVLISSGFEFSSAWQMANKALEEKQ